jgi:hypothetical protein
MTWTADGCMWCLAVGPLGFIYLAGGGGGNGHGHRNAIWRSRKRWKGHVSSVAVILLYAVHTFGYTALDGCTVRRILTRHFWFYFYILNTYEARLFRFQVNER